MARWTAAKKAELLKDPGIIRNRLKVEAAQLNAKAFLKVIEEYGSFDTFIWSFVKGKPIENTWSNLSEIPAFTVESDTMSKELKKKGFTFTGSTICYAFMQAVGMVNDHSTSCFRYKELRKR